MKRILVTGLILSSIVTGYMINGQRVYAVDSNNINVTQKTDDIKVNFKSDLLKLLNDNLGTDFKSQEYLTQIVGNCGLAPYKNVVISVTKESGKIVLYIQGSNTWASEWMRFKAIPSDGTGISAVSNINYNDVDKLLQSNKAVIIKADYDTNNPDGDIQPSSTIADNYKIQIDVQPKLELKLAEAENKINNKDNLEFFIKPQVVSNTPYSLTIEQDGLLKDDKGNTVLNNMNYTYSDANALRVDSNKLFYTQDITNTSIKVKPSAKLNLKSGHYYDDFKVVLRPN